MHKKFDSNAFALTAIAPAIWGSTYFVTSEWLPTGYPITIAMLRALPAGLILLLMVRSLPTSSWWLRLMILGALNFSVFWTLLFVSAYRLPGGIAATIGSLQPLMVIFIARLFLNQPIINAALASAAIGVAGVALLVLSSSFQLDIIGIIAALASALSMALGTVLSRRWLPPVPLLTFTAWQLSAGGLLLLPAAFILEPSLPSLSITAYSALAYLSLIGAALTYFLWFRGIASATPATISMLGFLSPLTATLLGWFFLQQKLNLAQGLGAMTILLSLFVAARAHNSVAGSLKNTTPT